MKGFQKSKTRWLLAVVLTCALALGGWGTGKILTNAAGGNTDFSATVTYDVANDTVKAMINSTTAYPFYTTTNATKKVPAANQWIRTDAGVVDLSGVAGTTTLYFAKTTTPASPSEIVAVQIPAQPVLAVAAYKPGGVTANADITKPGDFFDFQTVVKYSTKNKSGKEVVATKKVPVPTKFIEVRLSDNSAWGAFDTVMTATALEKIQRNSAVIYARIAKTAKVSVNYDNDPKVDAYVIHDLGNATGSGKTITYSPRFEVANEGGVDGATTNDYLYRPGVSKAIKIAKRAFGPVPKIDYANHCMTVAKGQAYGKATKVATEPSFGEAVTEKSGVKAYFGTNGTVSAEEYYGVKTAGTIGKSADSLTTFVTVPKDSTLAASAYAWITGGFGTAATLKITDINAAKAYTDDVAAINATTYDEDADKNAAAKAAAIKKIKTPAVAYQYAIVSMTGAATDPVQSKSFDYSQACTWKTVKTGNDGTISVTIPWNEKTGAFTGKQVLVRKAAVGTSFSSQVEVFKAPTASVNYWLKVAQAAYTSKFLTDATGTKCASIDTQITNLSSGQFKITINGVAAAAALNAEKLTVAVGKTKYAVSVPKNLSKNTATITVTGLPTTKATVTFTYDEGFVNTTTSATVPSVSKVVTNVVING